MAAAAVRYIMAATAIGDLVPGFFFALAGTLPAWYQIAALAAACIIAALLLWHSQAEGDG